MSVTNFRRASLKTGLPKSSEFADIAAANPAIPISTAGLIRYYTMQNATSYPGTGTTWVDLVGSGYDMTFYNGPTYTAGTPNYMTFDGSNDYADTNDSNIPMGSSARTIGVWFYSLTSGDGKTVVDYGTAGTFNAWVGWSQITGYSPSPGQYINFYGPWLPTSLSGAGMPSGGTWTLNQWSWNSNGDWVYYSNGTQQNSGNVSSSTVSTVSNGTFRICGNSAYNSPWNARIGSVFIYNTALNGTQMADNYDKTKAEYGL